MISQLIPPSLSSMKRPWRHSNQLQMSIMVAVALRRPAETKDDEDDDYHGEVTDVDKKKKCKTLLFR